MTHAHGDLLLTPNGGSSTLCQLAAGLTVSSAYGAARVARLSRADARTTFGAAVVRHAWSKQLGDNLWYIKSISRVSESGSVYENGRFCRQLRRRTRIDVEEVVKARVRQSRGLGQTPERRLAVGQLDADPLERLPGSHADGHICMQ
jgi:hypothetical protein